MTLFGGFLTIAICAAIAAWFAGNLPTSRPVDLAADILDGEGTSYGDPGAMTDRDVWDFINNEQFYRNFIINMSFGGITLATSGYILRDAFFDISNAVFYVILNLAVVVVNVSVLKDDSRPLRTQMRKSRNWLLAISFSLLFVTGLVSGGWSNLEKLWLGGSTVVTQPQSKSTTTEIPPGPSNSSSTTPSTTSQLSPGTTSSK